MRRLDRRSKVLVFGLGVLSTFFGIYFLEMAAFSWREMSALAIAAHLGAAVLSIVLFLLARRVRSDSSS